MLVHPAECDLWGAIWGSYYGRENYGRLETWFLGHSTLWACLSIQGMKRVMALLTFCRLLGIAGRPWPGTTGFLSASGTVPSGDLQFIILWRTVPFFQERFFWGHHQPHIQISKSNTKRHFPAGARRGALTQPHHGRCRTDGGETIRLLQGNTCPRPETGLSPIASVLCQAPGQGGAQASAVTALCAPKNRLALGSVHLGWLSLLAEVAASSSVKPEYNI